MQVIVIFELLSFKLYYAIKLIHLIEKPVRKFSIVLQGITVELCGKNVLKSLA